MSANTHSPHRDAAVFESGIALRNAAAAIILLHGRGGSAEDILALGSELDLEDVSLLAPQAAGNTWYPNSFLAPIPSNEPWLTSAMELIHSLVNRCEEAKIPTERVAIVGFSQGACLASEYIACYPRRYGALVAFTGGLLGPQGSDLHHPGRLSRTPILLSSGDPDPHVPWTRVQETADQFTQMGASVHTLRHPGRPHMVLPKEIQAAHEWLQPLLSQQKSDIKTSLQ